MPDSATQKKLDALYQAYSKALPKKLMSIETLWQDQLQNWDLERLHDFHREVHSLSGSSGTYGYLELSQKARELEIQLKLILNAETIDIPEKQIITHQVVHLKNYCSSTSQALPSQDSAVLSPQLRTLYLLETDAFLVQEIYESLQYSGYNTVVVKDIDRLKNAVKEEPPLGIILSTDFLNQETIAYFSSQKQEALTGIVQLFGIIPNKNLLPRLAAIRAGCQSFFQKPVDISYLTQVVNQKCAINGNESYRILILDDCESLGDYYALILNQAGMHTEAITNPLDLLTKLESFQPDLLLMDLYMPHCNGLELAMVLRYENKYTTLPIIFLSAEEDKNKQLSAISLGGDDFLTKPISPQHLISVVKSRSKRASVLNYYMVRDSLTGLLNHSSILKQLEIEIKYAQQKQRALSFIMLDIDYFKKINDNYGHPVGDMVIKKLAAYLSVRMGNCCTTGRYGGEEFAVIIPNLTIEESEALCNDFRIEFSNQSFIASETFYVTLSFGISCLQGDMDASQMVLAADEALYQAKQGGRNQVVTTLNRAPQSPGDYS